MINTSHIPTADDRYITPYRLNRHKRFLVVAFVVSFSLDFKGSTGGSAIQYLMAVVSSISFLLLATSSRMSLPLRGFGAVVFWIWTAFLLIGTVGAFANAVAFEHYVRVIYPFVLFLEGFLVVWWTARHPADARMIISAMIAAAVVSLFFTAWWGFYFTGEDVTQIRYQILSPLIPLLVAAASYDLFFIRRRRIWSIISLSAVLALIAISVTRGLFLILGLVTVLVSLAAFGNIFRQGTLPRPIVRAFVWGLILSLIALAGTTLFYPDVLARWVQRSLSVGYDTSFWTRVASVVGQFQALTSNSLSWLIGKGFGSSYPWPVYEFPWIVPFLGKEAADLVWFPGEFMWMPFLYYGGFFVGLCVALVLLGGAIRSFRMLGVLLRAQSWRTSEARTIWIAVFSYIAFLGMGFTANPFILRSAALFFGLSLGLIIVIRAPSSKLQ